MTDLALDFTETTLGGLLSTVKLVYFLYILFLESKALTETLYFPDLNFFVFK